MGSVVVNNGEDGGSRLIQVETLLIHPLTTPFEGYRAEYVNMTQAGLEQLYK